MLVRVIPLIIFVGLGDSFRIAKLESLTMEKEVYTFVAAVILSTYQILYSFQLAYKLHLEKSFNQCREVTSGMQCSSLLTACSQNCAHMQKQQKKITSI